MRIRSSGRRGLAQIAALAMILGACSAGPGVTTLPTNSHAPTALATLTATISAAPSAAAGPIGEGTYQSQAVPIATIIAKINADTELTDSEKASAAAGFSGHQTQVVELNFHSGQLTQSSAFDGAPFEVGDRFTYASPDDHTLVVQETCCGSISTFDLAPGANSFTLKYRTGVPNAEDIIGQTIFELSPFTLVP